MATLEQLSAKVRNFYAHIDPNKSQADMDEITFSAYQHGESFVNEQLRKKYGRDLTSFPQGNQTSNYGVDNSVATAIPVASVATSVPMYHNSSGGAVLGAPGQQMPMYVDQYGRPLQAVPMTAAQQQMLLYEQRMEMERRQQANDNSCICCTALLSLLFCLSID